MNVESETGSDSVLTKRLNRVGVPPPPPPHQTVIHPAPPPKPPLLSSSSHAKRAPPPPQLSSSPHVAAAAAAAVDPLTLPELPCADDVVDAEAPPLVPPRRKRGAVRISRSSASSNSNRRDLEMPVWGYGKSTGPHTWAVHFPLASGKRQSPIDICSGRGEAVNFSQGLSWTYDPEACDRITNTGTGWKLLVSGSGELWGGPLPSKYKLEQIHAHWGRVEDEGSEHTVDGIAFPGELHLVHWDCEKYKNFEEAANAEGGLTVLGVFMQIGDEPHEEVQKIVDALALIPNKGITRKLSTAIDPVKLLPESKAFWNYEGSLTTPPCLETVNWIVFKNPVIVSKEQLAAFRDLRAFAPDDEEPGVDEFRGQIVQNFRPPMPLCGRVIRDCC